MAPPDTQAQAARVKQIRSDSLDKLLALWVGLKSWRSEQDIQRFLLQALPIAQGGQAATSNATAAGLAAQYAALTNSPLRHLGVPLNKVTGKALRGVDPRTVYTRPFIQLYTALSKGASFDDALRQGTNRLQSIALTDFELSLTHTARYFMERRQGVRYFKRTLQGAKSCALCVVASTQRYHTGDLMPIHPGCDCGVEPLPGNVDPGQIIDPARLDAVHKAISDIFGTMSRDAREIFGTNSIKGDPLKYRDVIVVNHHGEIGPVIGVRGQKFTGPGGLPG